MKITFRTHAVRRMFERSVSTDEVRAVIATGEIIADYPDDTPYPSRLMLGWRGDRPLHVVAAYNGTGDEMIVVTVYEPAAADWEPDFRRKKR